MFDIAIIGAGPGGYVAAIRAAQLGAKVALIEKAELGGVCLNRGCIPTKALLRAANLLKELKSAPQLGIEVSGLAINFPVLMARKDLIVKGLAQGVQMLLAKNQIELIRGQADIIGPQSLTVGGEAMKATRIIIAVGSEPHLPMISGVDGPQVITSDQAVSLAQLPESMVIIGGGVIGIEMAVLFQSLGCAITVIEMTDRLAPMMDQDISKELREILKRQGIKIVLGARVESIAGGEVTFTLKDEYHRVQADKVLMATGRRSNGLRLSLDRAGIKHQKGVIETDEQFETSIPGIYAIGDVKGGLMLAHVATAEAVVAVETMLGYPRRIDYSAIPQCIYAVPEVAAVGCTEEQARQAGPGIKISRFPLAANSKAQTEGVRQGFIKLIAELKTGRLLGAHIIAPHATEMIALAAGAIALKVPVEELAKTVFPHPTVSEIMGEALHGLVDQPIHI